MIQKIVHGYGKLLLSLVKILALIGLCAIFAFLLVLPLWKFASIAPGVYSATIIILFAVGIVFFIVKSLRNFLVAGFPTPQERRKRIHYLFNILGRILVVLFGLVAMVICILQEITFAVWLILLLTIILYGVLAFGKKEKK